MLVVYSNELCAIGINLTYIVLVKGYLRKGATLVALKNYSQAQAAYEKALELHPNHPVSAFEGVKYFTFSGRFGFFKARFWMLLSVKIC